MRAQDSGGGSLITPSTDPNALAQAMSAQPGLVTGASWPALDNANPSSGNAAGVATGPGIGKLLPTDGNSFAVLTNGDVTLADPPNDESGDGADNNTSWRGVNDPTQLEVDVNVPQGAACLALDGAFYSEEYPEYVGSAYNDGFIAELDHSTWSYDATSNSYTAPDNFAFDDQGHLITVNSVSFQSDQADTGLQYDGSTKLLTMSTPVTPGPHKLYFSIFDAGDHVLDSAMFLDNLRTSASANCSAGATVADADGDGIPDDWEKNGVTVDGQYINLPAMGADPNHKDVFVQVNAMDGLRPANGAMRAIETAFNDAPVSNPDGATGIHLHIDNGSSSVMDPVTGATWGSLSQAQSFPWQGMFGPDKGDFPWHSVFDPIKQTTFTNTGREPIFHLALAISWFDTIGHTGLSRSTSTEMASSDFMVAMQAMGCQRNHADSCPEGRVAGTFMHELGHNLGLHHGGQDDINAKPNYPSVMNYLFQFSLVPGPRGLDYSRLGTPDMPTLDESNLDENIGLGAPGDSVFASALTYLPLCDRIASPMSGPIDYNCNGDSTDTDVSANLNPPPNGDTNATDILTPADDWNDLLFKDGAIGGQGLSSLLPDDTDDDEAPNDQLQAVTDQIVPPPSISTDAATGVTDSAATVAATANPDGHPAQVTFQYGTTSDWDQAAETNPVDVGSGSSPTSTTAVLTSLSAGTTYHYRAVVTTDTDQEFGAESTFTTAAAIAQPPTTAQPPATTPQPPATTLPPVNHGATTPKTAKWAFSGRPRLDRRGRLLVVLRCTGTSCKGTLAVTTVVKTRHGRKTRTLKREAVSVSSGRTRTFTLALRKADARAVRRGLKVQVTATLTGGPAVRFAGRPRVLKAPRHKVTRRHK